MRLPQQHPGPLIVVANHSAGVDPILVQCGMRGHIRWMMDRQMMLPALEWLWRHQRVVPVDVEGGDARAALVAIRHLREGGVLGVFPEGRIARPPERLLPFMPGVGVLVAKSGARVLLCWISGTPKRERAFESLFATSASRVHFLELIHYPPRTRPSAIVEDLRQRLARASGWPTVEDEPD
jgi:1-acyl-sn-glycerol-3-phosphate acyltransferase